MKNLITGKSAGDGIEALRKRRATQQGEPMGDIGPPFAPGEARAMIQLQPGSVNPVALVVRQPSLFPTALGPVAGTGRIEFTVYGEQRPQGSKIPQVIYRKDGTPVIGKNGRVLSVVRNDNPHLESWRNQVASAAHEAAAGVFFRGPVQMTVCFTLVRPKSHYGTGKNSGKLKASAPKFPIVKPDSTKLLRAIEDAMSNVVWGDDSQVVRHDVSKAYGTEFITKVVVEEIN